jgi:phosphatidate cytidylyltransferase
MILDIYIIIFIYFVIGGFGFYFIYRKKDPQVAAKNRTKFISYFLIIHTLFFSIVIEPVVFHYLALFILFIGLGEIIGLFLKSGYEKKWFFSLSLMIFLLFGAGFICFSRMDKNLILFTFLILSVFDAFSQISGQLMGRYKLFPSISPGKTIEGFAGGAIIAVASSLLLTGLTGYYDLNTLVLASGIVLSAFTGDMFASFYKRKYMVKDYSNLIPGHGGFLDRFDSLVAGAAFIAILDFTGL